MTTYVDHVFAKRINIYVHHMNGNGVVFITTTVHQMVQHVFSFLCIKSIGSNMVALTTLLQIDNINILYIFGSQHTSLSTTLYMCFHSLILYVFQ